MSENRLIKKIKNSGFWYAVPPWIMIGSVIVLLPIFTWWTIDSIKRQKDTITLLHLEKGAALIRSFEAGTRTGMTGNRWTTLQLQRLLTETAKLPDIKYIMVVDSDGTIIAHSDQSRIGTAYQNFQNIRDIVFSKELQSREVTDSHGQLIFEVFRLFTPRRVSGRIYGNRGLDNDLSRNLQQENVQQENVQQEKEQAIFVGMDTSQIEAARIKNVRGTVIRGVILLLLGLGGISSLFLLQAFRTAKSSLKKIKAFSDNLVESMPIGLVALDQEKKIASFNNVAESMLFHNRAPSTGESAVSALPPEIIAMIEEIDVSREEIEREVSYHNSEGKKLILETSVSIIESEDGIFLGHIILLRDLTEIRGLEREIERSRRLASIGGLAAGVAHEIRNPLSSIKGFATYFSERYKDVPEDKKTAEVMIQEVERLNRVIGQLLEFARPVNIQKRPISLLTLIDHSVKIIERDAEKKNIRIDVSGVPDNIGPVSVDSDRMSQVFLNLYLNAIDAMPEGGTLTTKALIDKDSDMIRIIITDTGRGIEQKDLAHVFDPYFTSKQSGTGLGLSIVHRIIESHNGQVTIESEPGRGTRVIVTIPMV